MEIIVACKKEKKEGDREREKKKFTREILWKEKKRKEKKAGQGTTCAYRLFFFIYI